MNGSSSDEFCTSADGLRLFYCDYQGAHATPVVCLPGLTRNSRDFTALAERLSPRYHILTLDFRGRGRSAWDPIWQNYHPGTYVADVVAVLKRAGVQRAVIVGTSLGGIVAMLLGASFPQHVAGLILNDVGPEVSREAVARISQYVGRNAAVSTWEEAARQARETYGGALPDYADEDWLRYAQRSYREDESGRPMLDMDPRIGDAVRATAGTGPAPDLWPLWAALTRIPMLAIRGERSDVLSVHTLDRMLRSAPGLQTVTVPNRGHAPTLDEPICIEEIERFLDKLPDQP